MGATSSNAQAPSLWGRCSACGDCSSAEWLECEDGDGEFAGRRRRRGRETTSSSTTSEGSGGGRQRSTSGRGSRQKRCKVQAERLEELTKELFVIHDLNRNGLLEEEELIRLNERIAMLHHGQDFDTSEVRATYRGLFREKLDPEGRPVAYEVFRKYALEVLNALDEDPEAQEMILEQFVAEAESGAALMDTPSVLGEERSDEGADGGRGGTGSTETTDVDDEDVEARGTAGATGGTGAESPSTDSTAPSSPSPCSKAGHSKLLINDMEQRAVQRSAATAAPPSSSAGAARELTVCRAAVAEGSGVGQSGAGETTAASIVC